MAGHGGRDLSKRGAHVVSPELVLVDPVLAEHARSWLPPGDDTLARFERMLEARRVAASRAQRLEQARVSPDESPRARRAHAIPRGVVRLAVASGAALLAVGAVLVGVRIDVEGDPARAGSTETATSSLPSPGAGPRSVPASSPTRTTSPKSVPKRPKPDSRPDAPARAGSRSFAWAPVAGASGYHVEFFRGSSRVFSADTKSPTIVIRARWRLGGRTRSLEPGEYRWYVWALVSGTRAPQATVRAKLVVEG